MIRKYAFMFVLIAVTAGMMLLTSCSKKDEDSKKQVASDPQPLGSCYPYNQQTVQCFIGQQVCYIYWSGAAPAEVVCTGK